MDDNKVNLPALGDPSNKSAEVAQHYYPMLVEVARESFLILDSNLRVVSANPTFYQNFKVKPEETENVLLYDLGNGQWNIPDLKKLLEEILPQKKDVRDYEVKHSFESIGEKTILLNARQMDTSQLIILAMEDISVRKELEMKLAATAMEKEEIRIKLAITAKELATNAEEKEDVRKKLEVTALELKDKAEALAIIAREKEDVRVKLATTAEALAAYTTGIEAKAAVVLPGESGETNAQNEAILASIGDGLAMVDIAGNIIYVNKSFEQMLGWKMQEVTGKSMVEVVPTEDINKAQVQFREEILSKVLAGEKFVADLTNPFYFICRDKSRIPVSITVTPVFISGKIVGAVETFRDITQEKAVTESLVTQVKELERMNSVMVGRELKMIELKKEVEKLKNSGVK